MGSIVGGMYAGGVSLNDIENILNDGSLRKAYAPRFVPAKIIAGKLFQGKAYAGLTTGKKYQDFLESNLPDPNEQIQDCKIPFSAVATNLLDGKAYRINEGNLATVIRASSSLSPILKPVEIDGKLYCDGGVRANLPALAARETGANIVIAVLVDEPLRVLPKETFRHYSQIASRLTDIVLAVTDEHQLQFADIVVNPDVSGIPVFSRNGKRMRESGVRAEQAGEMAAIKALPEIRKRLGIQPSLAVQATNKTH